jgi:hypothetical protein
MIFTMDVLGRPAPQGSKLISGNGAMREASAYLPAWRAAVKRACYEAYRAAGIAPETLPLFGGPVTVDLRFRLATAFDDAPDVDKLARAVLDALGGSRKKGARVFDDDCRVVLLVVSKLPGPHATNGCRIEVAHFYAPGGVVV